MLILKIKVVFVIFSHMFQNLHVFQEFAKLADFDGYQS